ncbi:MAG: hypothetical protein JWN78_2506 [Bacteroidota bacterium]|nr:hypothetical protein [Bacteroidota bacterium]
MVGCKNEHSSNSILITAKTSSLKNSKYKIISLGNIVTIENNIKAIQLDSLHNFGFTVEANVSPNKYYYLSLKVKSKKFTVNLATESVWNGWRGSRNPTINNSNGWYNINLLIKTPDTIKEGKVKIYGYTWTKDTSYIDSLKITEYNYFPFKDSIPDFIFNPLTYDLLRELAFFTRNVSASNYYVQLDGNILNRVFDRHFITKGQYKDEFQRRQKNHSIFSEVKDYAEVFKNPSINHKPRETYETLLTGFSENVVYTQGENVKIKLQNATRLKSVQLLKPINNYKFERIKDITLTKNDSFYLSTIDLTPGTYCIQLKDNKTTFNIPVIINSKVPSDIILLAPVTTWQAYNYYNGKCFYVNTKDDSCVYHISTQRPLVSCLFDSLLVGHDLFIFDNIYNFFYQNYKCNIYPDYYLEAHPELFINAKTIVFVQHCEYFSTKMIEALAKYSTTKNIISLGGNQAYYKIQFSNDFKNIECRKDGTFLDNTLIPAGFWRTNISNEAKYWGNAFTDAGYESYCSYKVKNASHWLFENCNVHNGQEFGQYGIDNRGLSGDEMDKINDNTPANAVLLAKGTNPDNGGGEIVIIENKTNKILSFGSIACGSGIYKDKVFTQMVHNFMRKTKTK